MLKKVIWITTALYLSMAGSAEAMPTIVGGIAAIMSTQIAAGVTLGSIALSIASMGAQWLISKMLTPDAKQRGIKARMSTGGDNPPTFIVGEYATPGQLVYINEKDGGTNIPQSLLVMVVQLSCMPVDSVSNEVFISNERCTINTGTTFPGGFYAVDEYVKGTGDGGYCSMKFHLGGQSTADAWLMSNFGSDPDRPWKNTMFLPGCAYAIIRCWYSNRGIWAGMPTFRFVVRGAPLYDPRKDSTVGGSGSQRRNNPNTWTYSKNAKVIEYNTHIGFWYDGDHVWGGRAEPYRLPLEYWFAAMNACDENITKKNGDVIKRYVIGAEISLDDKPIELVTEINKSCDGYTTEYGGTYKTWCGAPGLPVATITDDDWLITQDMETNRFQGREQTFNTCYPTYPEPKQMWEVKEAPSYVNSDALAEDGEELPLDLALPLVTESNQVQRLAKSAVRDSRRQVTHSGVLPPMAYIYEPFDVLNYQSDDFGYGSGKRFLFAFGDDLPDVNQQVLLREVNPDDQGYVPADEQDFEASPLVIIRPGELVLDLNVFADQVDSTSGKDKPAIRAEWTWGGADIDVDYVDWRLRRVGSTTVVDRGKITRIDDNQAVFTSPVLRFGRSYEVQFRPKPFAIRESAWTAWKSVTCVVVDVPAAPSLTRVSKLGTDGKLNYFVDVGWTLVSQEGTYAVRLIVDGQTTIYPAQTTPLRIPVAAGSSLVVDVAAVGADGTRGNWSATTPLTITKKNTAPTAPTSLTATGKIGRIDYLTNKNPDSDFDHFNLYGSNTNDFTTAVLIDDSRSIRLQQGDLGNAVTRYAWITAVDSSGNESAKFPASNTAGRTATTTRIVAADIDDGAISDAKIDQTSPLAASVSLSAFGADYDEDGTIDAGLTITATNPNSGRTIVRYIAEVQRSDLVGGTYTNWQRHVFDAEDTPAVDPTNGTLLTLFTLKANRKKFHRVRVRAVAGNGKKGPWSGYTSPGIQPGAATGYAGQSASAPAVVSIANGYRISWTKPADSIYYETQILVDGVGLQRVNGNAYSETTVRTVGATPTFTVRHFDKLGNVTNTSTGTVAPAYRAASATEVGVLGSGNLGAGSVIASKTVAQDTSNMADNGWMTGDLSGWTVQSLQSYAIDNAQGDASGWIVTARARDIRAVQIPVNPGETYYFDVWVKQTDTSRAQIMVQTETPAGAYTFPVVAFTDTKGVFTRLTGQWTVPAGVTKATMLLQNDRTNGVGTDCSWSRPIMRRVSDASLIGEKAVKTTALGDLSVTVIKADLGDTTNLVKANNGVDPVLYTATAVGGATAVGLVSLPNTSSTLGPGKNKLRASFTTTTTVGDGIVVATTAINPCSEGKRYTFSGYVNGVTNATLLNITLSVDWYTLDASGLPVFLSASVNSDTLPTGAVRILEFSETAPATAAFFVLKVKAVTIAGIANARVIDIGSLSARVANNGVFEYATPGGGFNIGSGVTNTPLTIVSNHTKAARFVSVAFAFKNTAGGPRAVTVQWWKTPLGGAATQMLSRDFTLADDGPFYMEFFDSSPSTDSTTYECRVTNNAGSALTLNGRYAVTQAFFG